ncbi:MAG: MarR family transcriptional regulator [Bacteroidales bacterium]|nr:MarR family transcriptional regulator [Clostridium sp.]MCM1204131.1 MarR family transcriptional regulator [Bacteroidales bacterium]
MIERFELFTTTIGQIYKNLQRIKMQEMAEFQLKGAHVMCLFELNRNKDGLTVTQLSQLCGEDKAAVSRTVSDLVKRGLVTTDSKKKYRAPILLTAKGQSTADRVDEMVTEAVLAGSDGLTDAERTVFYHALTKISENLKNYLNE